MLGIDPGEKKSVPWKLKTDSANSPSEQLLVGSKQNAFIKRSSRRSDKVKLYGCSFSREAADRPALNTSNTSNTNKLRSRLDDRAALRLAIGGFGPKMAHTEKTLSSKLEKRS